jgi:N-hydroxyarylamine O-acetyltransferase
MGRQMQAPDMMATLDPRAYLERIHSSSAIDLTASRPSLALLRALHEAHLLTVPFENLSIHYGQPILLGDTALYAKIVGQHRGGFCYELNGLFAWLLTRLGFTVSRLSARVAQPDGGFTPDFDHMALRIHHLEGADWLADVGFGDSFRQPLRIQHDLAQDGADGLTYRLRFNADERAWLLQQRGVTDWVPQYRFTLQAHPVSDFAERCQFHQTAPESHFTQKRICSLALPDGRITLSDLRLLITRDGKRDERTLASEEEYRAVLAERFGVTLPSV